MGDGADYLTSNMDVIPEEWDGWEQPSHFKTCRACGKTGLHWQYRHGKWRLFDNRGMHACKVNPLKETAVSTDYPHNHKPVT